MAPIVPVILSGGSGTRLWPLSRHTAPKQLLPLTSARTLLQETALRVGDRFGAPVVIGNGAYADMVEEQLAAVGCTPAAHILEPFGRNTAPAAAVAALVALGKGADALVLLLPADHHIGDTDLFVAAVETAAEEARTGRIVTFGILPTAPETGFGYIRRGASRGREGVYAVAEFVEKPDAPTAERYLRSGEYSWNSGMFLAPAGLLLEEMAAHCPDVLAAARRAFDRGERSGVRVALEPEAFGEAPAISIDYAVMEHTKRASVLPVKLDWNDVGSWAALWDLGGKDEGGNCSQGDVLLHDARGTYVRANSRLVAVIGAEDLVIVETDDAVLVARRDRVQDVKAIVDRLKARS